MEYIIDIQNVKKWYPKKKSKEVIEAVKGISLQVKRGEVVGLLGPNGAGKTTLIKMMCGLLIPNEGTVKINEFDMNANRSKALKHLSVVLEGNRNLYWRLTVKENLEYFSGNRGMSKKEISSKVDELLERFNLKGKAHEQVNTLSRGMQQKLSIAVALLADTDIIFLDEPTLGLDIETSYEIRKLLTEIAKGENKTILLSSHDMPVVQDICQRVVIVNGGKIITDENVQNLLDLFDTKAYSFTLQGKLTDAQFDQLSHTYLAKRMEGDGEQSVIEVTIQQSDQFYAVIEQLKEMGQSIEKIDRTMIDFEQVFMKIVKGEIRDEVAISATS
ncbi:ABC transporter ATP-binding protein [Falsibacillus albus]|uniref:ABC transporter ATP-binding protein n=1 Tax=Falsibacillus albus TaxID=2478915 RepID=A0A3L7JRA3_9BACI|nr:ABC transporter ATP-binding protein [Falsibacillus albus]RLQ93196.1 ABC transporter ATP-binding protein [Falsibacillus albus]